MTEKKQKWICGVCESPCMLFTTTMPHLCDDNLACLWKPVKSGGNNHVNEVHSEILGNICPEKKGSVRGHPIYTEETMKAMVRERDSYCKQNLENCKKYQARIAELEGKNEALQKWINEFRDSDERLENRLAQVQGYIAGKDKRIAQLEGELEKHRWIPVSEGLPKNSNPVLLFCDQQVVSGYLDRFEEPIKWQLYTKGHRDYYQDKVTHWKSLTLPETEVQG